MTSESQDPGEPQGMGELLESLEQIKPLVRGDVIDGIVMRADHDGILVNIGHKSEGIIPPGEMTSLRREDSQIPSIGDEIVAYVIKGESAERAAILSIDKAIGEQGWSKLQKALETGKYLVGTITGFNRGGSMVEVEGVQAFVPMSQIVTVPRDTLQQIRDENDTGVDSTSPGESTSEPGNLQSDQETKGSTGLEYVGKKIELKVLELNRSRNRAILSERQAVQDQREKNKAELIKELKLDEIRRGIVTGLSTFGAFIDLGGADGLVHISELSWSPVSSPDEILTIGQEIDVKILKVDSVNNKIALSLKQTQPEPWDNIDEQLNVGDIVNGTIERNDLITEELHAHLKNDLKLSKLDKLFQVIIKCAVFEFLYKPKISTNIIIKEYLNASNFFIDDSQTKYLNALLDKISKKIRISNE